MTAKQQTEFIKMCLFYYFRIIRQCKLICSEFGKYNADVFAEYNKPKNDNNKKQYEIEIKVSKADFDSEFNVQSKFKSAQKVLKHCNKNNKIMYFYVCVPENLKDYVMEKINSNENYKNYGIMTCDFSPNTAFKNRIKIIKNAIKNGEYKDFSKELLNRMSSEIFCVRKQYVAELCRIKINSIGKIKEV
jgi:ribosomal protein L22